MIILGLNSDDVGTQFEELTRRLLQHHGYENVELNPVGPGGQELDVTAEFPVAGVGGAASPELLIGECKAHQSPVALPDWLKFIGKLHVAAITSHQPRRGLFVALNGVNANVRESLRRLVAEGDRLTLIEGDQLLDEALQVFGGSDREKAVAAVRKLTSRQFVKVEIAYRAERLYWIFTFGDGAIAVLDGNGRVPGTEEMRNLTPHLNNRLENAPIVDLVAEKEAQRRFLLTQKFCLARLFAAGGVQPAITLRECLPEVPEAELTRAVAMLQDRGWVLLTDKKLELAGNVERDGLSAVADLLRVFLTDPLTVKEYAMLATSELFSKLFDERAIAEMGKIQGELPFPKNDWKHILWLTEHSPSALAYALNADPMIHTHRTKQPNKSDDIDRDDAQRFIRSLLSRFSRDFREPALASFYFKHHRLVELEVKQITKIKGKDALVLERETNSRTGIGQWSEEYGGGLVFIDVLTSAPQPWEWMEPTTTQPVESRQEPSGAA